MLYNRDYTSKNTFSLVLATEQLHWNYVPCTGDPLQQACYWKTKECISRPSTVLEDLNQMHGKNLKQLGITDVKVGK